MISVADAAKRANRDPETIRRWIRAGKLTAWKVGGQHLIDEEDLASALRPTSSVPMVADDAATMDAVPQPARRASGSPAERRDRVGEAIATYGAAASTAPLGVPGIDPWLPQIVGRIVRAFDPSRIILFGSRARGDQLPDRDYDLLVCLDEIEDRRAARIAVRLAFGDLPVFSEILVATTAEIDGRVPGQPTGAVYWAVHEGVTIYDRDRVG